MSDNSYIARAMNYQPHDLLRDTNVLESLLDFRNKIAVGVDRDRAKRRWCGEGRRGGRKEARSSHAVAGGRNETKR